MNDLNNCPKISFIVVNYNGLSCLEECFNSIKNLNYPEEKIECVFVDNGSMDGSVRFIKENYTHIKIVTNDSNEGFAKPNNDGAKIATGEYLALINNDMKLDPNWLNDMLDTLQSCEDEKYVCVGSKILNFDGKKLDFAGGSISFYGHGFQFDYGVDSEFANRKYNKDKDILFACGGAMLIKKDVFLKVGGFDEDYFAYNEDVDLGWRLWILGYKVKFCSKALCYHKHSSTSKKFHANVKNELNDRNTLFTIYKNYESDKLYEILFSTLIIKMYKTSDEENDIIQSHSIRDFIDNFEKIKVKREFIQKQRKVGDKFIIDKFLIKPYDNQLLKYNFHNSLYNNIINKLINNVNLESMFGKKKNKVLIISSGSVGEKMAGPGIRYLEISKELSRVSNVKLAVPNNDCNLNLENYNIDIFNYNVDDYKKLSDEFLSSDIVIVQGIIFQLLPVLKNYCSDRIIIVDLYDPIVIEDLEINKKKNIKKRESIHTNSLDLLTEQIKLGDYFVCATEKQKDFWTGMLISFNRINPREYDLSNTLDKLIGYLPFGFTNEDPIHTRDAYEEKICNLKSDDKIFIWGGGIWNWFDPITIIKAVNNISKYRDDIKLFFLGIKHPNPDIPEMEMLNASVKLTEDLGIKDKHVFFNMDWVDYNDRHNFLLESYSGVSCHFNSLETRYSFRTRVLDYLWAGLPIITTEGDYFANEVQINELGIVVNYKDVEGMEKALVRISDDKQFYNRCKNNIREFREQFKWENVTTDLKNFCINPIKKQNKNEEMYSYILDFCQLEHNGTLEPIYAGKAIKQEFKCRYPNLKKIEIRIATYARLNEGFMIFKLYDKATDLLIYEEKIFTASVDDNCWHQIEFQPILNSEGRKFSFSIEAAKDVSKDNSFTLYYSKEKNEAGLLFYNDIPIEGNLSFRTSCMLTNIPLADKNGITLYDEGNLNSVINDIKGIDKSEKERLINRVNEINNQNKIIKKQMVNKIQVQNDDIKELNKSIAKINENIIEINHWKGIIEYRFNKIKKLNIFNLLKKDKK